MFEIVFKRSEFPDIFFRFSLPTPHPTYALLITTIILITTVTTHVLAHILPSIKNHELDPDTAEGGSLKF